MQCNALDSVTCGGALCFAAEEASDSDCDFDVDSKSDAKNSDSEEETKVKAGDDELANNCHGSGDVKGKSSGANSTSNTSSLACDSERKHDQHINDADKAVDAAEEAAVDDEESNQNAEGVADNEAEIVGKKVVDDNDDDGEGDDGTVDTALDVTQDVSPAEEDDDESAEVEPADVKIDLDDDSVDAIINALDDEFAPRKDEVAVVTDNDETEEEKDDEKSIDTNMTEDYSEENDRHAFTHVVQEGTNLTPQQQQWNDKHASLLKYYNKHGTSAIALKVNTKPKHLLLRRWADKQRLAFLNDELSPDQIQKFVAVEFDFGQNIDQLVAEKIEQERIEAEQKRAESLRLEEEAKAAAIRKEENHLKKLRKRMNHKKKVEQMRSEAISVVVGN